MEHRDLEQMSKELECMIEKINSGAEAPGEKNAPEAGLDEALAAVGHRPGFEEEADEDLSSAGVGEDALNRPPSAGWRDGLSLIRPSDAYLLAFFIPVIIMVIVFIQRGIFPFGENSFLRTDMYHQYAPFFQEFREKLTSGESLLYSWNVGMGVNFSALYAYYLASPLNWLIVLCPRDYVIEFMSYMVVVKIGLCGLSMAWYLRSRNRRTDIGAGVFGTFYALSGYLAAYSWNIMWLDCIILLPVIVRGAERLVNEKKPHLYCLALGLSILSNYYISIMICMFLVLWFFALQVLKGWKSFRELIVTGAQFFV